jgi:hypothetical protein
LCYFVPELSEREVRKLRAFYQQTLILLFRSTST